LKALVTILILSLSLLATNACKVNYSLNGNSVPAEAKTVSVAFFPCNVSIAPADYGQKFTDALRNKFSSQTRLNLVKNNGDLQFEGTVNGYRSEVGTSADANAVATNRFVVSISLKYSNKFDEKKNFERQIEKFVTFPGSKSFANEEKNLIEEINKQLTQEVFNAAFNDW
jgi:Lipopolysaccharide-assembly